jgi:hypothetical protein
MAQHRTTKGPLSPEPTIKDVFKEVEHLDEKVSQALNDLAEIKETLALLSFSLAELQKSVDEKE